MVKTVGRLLSLCGRPRPPLAILLNKHVSGCGLCAVLRHCDTHGCARGVQDEPGHLSCAHVSAAANCWFPPHTGHDSDALWCIQECVATAGLDVAGVVPWLCKMAAAMHIQESPRKRANAALATRVLRELACDAAEFGGTPQQVHCSTCGGWLHAPLILAVSLVSRPRSVVQPRQYSIHWCSVSA